MKSTLEQIFKLSRLQKKSKQILKGFGLLKTIAQPLIDYSITIKEVALNVFFYLVFFFIGLFGLLYAIKLFWMAYQSSPVGQKYRQLFIDRSYLISEFLSQNILEVSAQITWITFATCFGVCCVLRFFHVASLLYDSRRQSAKLVLFGLPLSLITGWNLYQASAMMTLEQAVIVALVPTLILFQKCFWAATQLAPELRDLFGVLKRGCLILKKILDRRT